MPAATETALCVNPDCARPFAAAARFCPFCATPRIEGTGSVPGWAEEGGGNPRGNDGRPARDGDQDGTGPGAGSRRAYRYSAAPPGAAADTGVVVLRAGESVWHAEEDEGDPPPGARRPLLVVDEQVTHLAHTDRSLTPEDLLGRVREHLDRDGVPIDVALRQARWLSDGAEARPRLIASLRGHRYSDVKMLLGVDYLGRWASIHLGLAVEPEPLPVPPEPEKAPPPPPYRAPTPLLWMIGISLLAAFGGSQMAGNANGFDGSRVIWQLVSGTGVVALVASVFALVVSASNHGNRCAALRQAWETEQRRRTWEWEQGQKRRREQRTAERLSRTFKVDDMRLFSTAMREVFQGVVDDIVSQGAQVARIEGGNGGFFRGGGTDGGGANPGVAEAAPAPRRSDASASGV